MSMELVVDIWNALHEFAPKEDRSQLANHLVGTMMEHGYDLDDIKHSFAGDSYVEAAVDFFRDDLPDDEIEYDDDDEADEYE